MDRHRQLIQRRREAALRRAEEARRRAGLARAREADASDPLAAARYAEEAVAHERAVELQRDAANNQLSHEQETHS